MINSKHPNSIYVLPLGNGNTVSIMTGKLSVVAGVQEECSLCLRISADTVRYVPGGHSCWEVFLGHQNKEKVPISV